MKTIKRVLILIACAVLLLSSTVHAEDTIVKEKEITVTDQNANADFEQQITEDGTSYKLIDVSSEVIAKEPVTEPKTVHKVLKNKIIDANLPYKPVKNFTNDDIVYTLSNVKRIKKIKKEAWKQKVTAYSQYDSLQEARSASTNKTVQARDAESNQNVPVVCKKTSVKRVADVWRNTHINILFKDYDANYYTWNGKTVKKNASSPLKGYNKALVKSVGGNTKSYKVKSISWNGKSYRKNGTVYRRARAEVRRKVPQYRVNYVGYIRHKTQKDIVVKATYTGIQQVNTGIINYKIKSTAVYEKDSNVTVIAATVGILLAIIITIGILFIVRKKRKQI